MKKRQGEYINVYYYNSISFNILRRLIYIQLNISPEIYI